MCVSHFQHKTQLYNRDDTTNPKKYQLWAVLCRPLYIYSTIIVDKTLFAPSSTLGAPPVRTGTHLKTIVDV